jgi:very-short-patch-repair endonuclease
VDSEFEAEVAAALRESGLQVLHQYPACGFSIDIVCEGEGQRLAVECDGEYYHTDEHGRLRMEDLERQAILERAGWRVLRIPYRKWLAEPDLQIARVLNALREEGESDDLRPPDDEPGAGIALDVTREEQAIIQAVREGSREQGDVLRSARAKLGHKRLGPNIRHMLLATAQGMNHKGLLVLEDGEYFLTPRGREAQLTLVSEARLDEDVQKAQPRARRSKQQGSRAVSSTRCPCGGTWILRRGRYGPFYGCSRFPRCRRTRSI